MTEKEESCHNPDMETSEKDVSAESHARVQSTHSFTMGACFAVDSTGLCTVDPRVMGDVFCHDLKVAHGQS